MNIYLEKTDNTARDYGINRTHTALGCLESEEKEDTEGKKDKRI